MPPKVRITKDDIIKAALELVRKDGEEALNARALATVLGSSTQPIFSNFANMTEVYEQIIIEGERLYGEYAKKEIETGAYPSVYKASGMAYIRFAKEERELFKLLFMRDRSVEGYGETRLFYQMVTEVQSTVPLSEDSAKLFHLEIWAFVHGIASMFITGYLNLEWDMVSRMVSDAFHGLKSRYEGQKE